VPFPTPRGPQITLRNAACGGGRRRGSTPDGTVAMARMGDALGADELFRP